MGASEYKSLTYDRGWTGLIQIALKILLSHILLCYYITYSKTFFSVMKARRHKKENETVNVFYSSDLGAKPQPDV